MLDSGIQLREGDQLGGVAGWLDPGGRPEFVYLEITGYFLTAAAWLGSGAASSASRRLQALDHGHQALEWMTRAVTDHRLPPTRLYLSPCADDWRNKATFSFDVAMAARGAAAFSAVAHVDTSVLLRRLYTRAGHISAGSALMVSHMKLDNGRPEPPARWSTRPGPHHLKAAAAFLSLPAPTADAGLRQVCTKTMSHWTLAMQASWPCRELHPLLYGIEGLLIRAAADNGPIRTAEQLYRRLLSLQLPDGTLPAVAGPGSCEVRSDVLAQALRVGALLRLRGRLAGAGWGRRLDLLASALVRHVRPDGGVVFSAEQDITNAWCAMFAHQALVLYAGAATSPTRGVDGTHLLI